MQDTRAPGAFRPNNEKKINVVLVVAAIIGLFLLVQQRSVLAQLRQEHDRLAAKYGTLDIRDRNKFYVMRLETESPLFELSKSDTLDRPMTILYRRFLVADGNGMRSVPDEPGPGILLWVRRQPTPSPSE